MGLSGLSGLSAFYRAPYTQKVLGIAPANLLAYWPRSEASGTTATDLSGNGRTGTDTGVTLGATGIGDGRTAASYDGTTSRTNVYSTSLRDAFNGPAGTLCIWAKVSGSGVWTDGVSRRLAYFGVDANNRVYLNKSTSQIEAFYVAGSTSVVRTMPTTSTGWLHCAITWDKAADQVKAYLNGAQVGATLTGLGTWAGTIVSTNSVIGALSTTPTNVFSGTLAHAALWNVALSAAQVASLAAV